MGQPKAKLLFVGEYPAMSPSLMRALSSLRCEWQYARSCEEALKAMEERKFHLVLSKSKLTDGSAQRLIPAVKMASGWLFLSFPVEVGCWWVPVIEDGRPAVNAALGSREFSRTLLKIVKTIVARALPEAAAERSGTREEPVRVHGD
jgi:hypothetical protein